MGCSGVTIYRNPLCKYQLINQERFDLHKALNQELWLSWINIYLKGNDDIFVKQIVIW